MKSALPRTLQESSALRCAKRLLKTALFSSTNQMQTRPPPRPTLPTLVIFFSPRRAPLRGSHCRRGSSVEATGRDEFFMCCAASLFYMLHHLSPPPLPPQLLLLLLRLAVGSPFDPVSVAITRRWPKPFVLRQPLQVLSRVIAISELSENELSLITTHEVPFSPSCKPRPKIN